jgi:hypothetical protein
MTRKRGRIERLEDRIRENRVPLFWLSLLIAALVTFYGTKAPAVILAVLSRYSLVIFPLMLMPFVTGLAGWTSATRSAWLKALLLPVLLGVVYQLLYHESIWRLWYQGAFDQDYLSGLVKASLIVPCVSFLLGLGLRFWLE